MIAIVNYGMGNTGSIFNMLKKIGAEACITDNPDIIVKADKIILPGVGTFSNGMSNLQDKQLDIAIKEAVIEQKTPLLGICLGMQLLGESSEEGEGKGLCLIPFINKKFVFEDSSNLKIPHMGWDIVRFEKEDLLLKGLEGEQRYYFVHSYYAHCFNKENVLMTCDYGFAFSAAVHKENIYGVQFHPEKSHKFGMKLLENFVRRI